MLSVESAVIATCALTSMRGPDPRLSCRCLPLHQRSPRAVGCGGQVLLSLRPWSMPPTSPCDHVQCLVHTRECARMRLNAAACASHVAGRARAFVCIQTRIRHPSTLALALSPHKPSDPHACAFKSAPSAFRLNPIQDMLYSVRIQKLAGECICMCVYASDALYASCVECNM